MSKILKRNSVILLIANMELLQPVEPQSHVACASIGLKDGDSFIHPYKYGLCFFY